MTVIIGFGNTKPVLKHLGNKHDQKTHGHGRATPENVLELSKQLVPDYLTEVFDKYAVISELGVLYAFDVEVDGGTISGKTLLTDEERATVQQALEPYRQKVIQESYTESMAMTSEELDRKAWYRMQDEYRGEVRNAVYSHLEVRSRTYETQTVWGDDEKDKVFFRAEMDRLGVIARVRVLESRMSDADKAALNELILKNTEGRVARNMLAEDLSKVLTSKNFKTQFSAGASGGMLDPDYRYQTEASMFGLATKGRVGPRPIYGFIDKGDGFAKEFTQYGDTTITFKDAIKSRSTFTLGDSLSSDTVPQALSGTANPLFAVRGIGNQYYLPRALQYVQQRRFGDLLGDFGFTEFQAHGGVKSSDIASVSFSRQPSESLIAQLEAAGIPFSVGKAVTIRVPAGFKPLLKHEGGGHDQSSHGHGSVAEAKIAVRYRGQDLDEGVAVVEAKLGDKLIGSLHWNYLNEPPMVVDVFVEPEYRRQGVATKLFNMARANESKLVHSDSLTSDGKYFLDALAKHLEGQHDQSSHGKRGVGNEWAEIAASGQLYPDFVKDIGDAYVAHVRERGVSESGLTTLTLEERSAKAKEFAARFREKGLSDEDAAVLGEVCENRAMKLGVQEASFYDSENAAFYAERTIPAIQNTMDYLSEASVIVAADARAIDGILADGRIKNQFETGRSNGLFKPQARRDTEAKTALIPPSAGAEARPIYGYAAKEQDALGPFAGEGVGLYTSGLTTYEGHKDNIDQYGMFRLVLNDDVKGRSTFTISDSLSSSASVTSFRETNPARVMQSSTAGYGLGLAFAYTPVRDVLLNNYYETQIFGRVTTKDIKKVLVPRRAVDGDTSSAIQKRIDALRAAGIQVDVVDETGIVTKNGLLAKHEGGGHDQSSHGNRGGTMSGQSEFENLFKETIGKGINEAFAAQRAKHRITQEIASEMESSTEDLLLMRDEAYDSEDAVRILRILQGDIRVGDDEYLPHGISIWPPVTEENLEDFKKFGFAEYDGQNGTLSVFIDKSDNYQPAYPLGQAERAAREMVVGEMIQTWATSSNSGVQALSLQRAAQAEFGLDNVSSESRLNLSSSELSRLDQHYDAHQKVYKDFLRTQYGATQKLLEKKGITEIDVWRGTGFADGGRAKGHTYTTRPLASWSLSASVADSFTKHNRSDGDLLRVTVPASRVLSFPMTGIGCLKEYEAVILGGPFKIVGRSSDEVATSGKPREFFMWNLEVDSAGVTKAVKKTFETLEEADWLKVLAWDLPTNPDAFTEEDLIRLSELPVWFSAPPEIKSALALLKAVTIRVPAGVKPVLKHGDHDQSKHGKRGAMTPLKIGPNGFVSTDAEVSSEFPYVGLSDKSRKIAERISDSKLVGERTEITSDGVEQTVREYSATYTDKNGDSYDLRLTESSYPWDNDIGIVVDGNVSAFPQGSSEAVSSIKYSSLGRNYPYDEFPTPVSRISFAGTMHDFQRKGLATALLEFSRMHSQTAVLHSAQRTGEGDSFATVVKHGDHDQSSHGRRSGRAESVKQTVAAIAQGQKATVNSDEVYDVLAGLADREELSDLTNLHVEGSTHLFDGENLGLTRTQMPQVPTARKEEFIEAMDAAGIKIVRERVSPHSLKPIQAEISGRQAGGIMRRIEKNGMPDIDNQRLIISKDGFVLDGHHRWAAAAALSLSKGDITMPVFRIELSHMDAIQALREWNDVAGIKPIALGERNPNSVFKFITPIAKHGTHNQSSHGNRGGGSTIISEYGDPVSMVDGKIGPRSSAYGDRHQAPSSTDGFSVNILQIEEMMPDVLGPKGERLYNTGASKSDKESMQALRALTSNPDSKVKVYRGVPAGVTDVNDGDWVSLSPAYAAQHVMSRFDGNGRVLAVEVPVSSLWVNGDSINEIGFDRGTVQKHDGGGHDQSSHGNRGGGFESAAFTVREDDNDLPFTSDYFVEGDFGKVFVRFEENDVELSDEIKQEVFQTVADLQTNFPRENASVVFDRDKVERFRQESDADESCIAFCTIGKAEITVDSAWAQENGLNIDGKQPDAFEIPSQGRKPRVRELLVHEWGHAVDIRSPKQRLEDLPDVNKLRKNGSPDFAAIVAEGLSEYGSTNGAEYFAEAFTEWFLSEGSTSSPAARRMAAKYGWNGTGVSKAVVDYDGLIVAETMDANKPPKYFRQVDGKLVEVFLADVGFEKAVPVSIVVPCGVKPVLKHGNHDQSSHGNRGGGQVITSNAPDITNEERIRLHGNSDVLVEKVYAAEQALIEGSKPRPNLPVAPKLADFDNYGEYEAAFNEFKYIRNQMLEEYLSNVSSPIGAKHLDGTKAGVTAYIKEVTSSDWFVERFGAAAEGMPPLTVALAQHNAAGSHSFGLKRNRQGVVKPVNTIKIHPLYARSEDTILHEIAHYATVASQRSSYEGHGLEFVENFIYIRGKVQGDAAAAELRAAYEKAGVFG